MNDFQIFKCKNNILKRHKRGASTKCIISSDNKSKAKKEKNLGKTFTMKKILNILYDKLYYLFGMFFPCKQRIKRLNQSKSSLFY